MLLIALALLSSAAESADIYKCTGPEGNVAYLQTPCPVEKKAAPVEETVVEESPLIQPAIAADRSLEEIEECKVPFRDEIDEVEAEMLQGYAAERADEFKEKLRTLTQSMRACG